MDNIEFKDEMLSIWQNILWRAQYYHVTPRDLAQNTRNYSEQLIEKGFKGERILITLDFLNDCVFAFGLANGKKEKVI